MKPPAAKGENMPRSLTILKYHVLLGSEKEMPERQSIVSLWEIQPNINENRYYQAVAT